MKLPTALIALALAAATPASAYENMSVRRESEGDQPQRRLGWFGQDYYKKVYCRCCEYITECEDVDGVTSTSECRCPKRNSDKTGWGGSKTYEEKFDHSCETTLLRNAGFD
mmetsp:Transcript_1421/g.3276  ORF Transcript_1421/g.3276 Transcript_1421/m.3276 type:complete len:111 (+) Transcript_1421:142-474(+)